MSKEIDRLSESIEITATIDCSKCTEIGALFGVDEYEAAHSFSDDGWRITQSGNIYCPQCASKKLRPRKGKK